MKPSDGLTSLKCFNDQPPSSNVSSAALRYSRDLRRPKIVIKRRHYQILILYTHTLIVRDPTENLIASFLGVRLS